MAYLALYREWRPKNFKDMVGQEHITKTLTNAILLQKVAHAYLFSGPRGTGKTSTAKVLAKALNCQERDGVEPCNQCSACLSIDQGNAMEVLEIDAASNRGIDEIRDLREKVRLSAGETKYKVYIIDEVHMLTTEAFNALLKTLEEPPERVVFILATTEVHKIPLTILSRVQRFEFHRIPLEQIQNHLEKVCQKIGRKVQTEALTIIAQKSEGGLRDALSILDQCLLLDGELGVEQVYQVLGMVGEDFSSKLVDQLVEQKYAETLQLLAEGINQGRDPRQIIRELLEYLRQALIYTSTGQYPYIAPHLRERLSQQCEALGLKTLLLWIGILLQGESQLKYATNARLAAELLLVQVIYDSQRGIGQGSAEVTRRLNELEQEIQKIAAGQTSGRVLKEPVGQTEAKGEYSVNPKQTRDSALLLGSDREGSTSQAARSTQSAHSTQPVQSVKPTPSAGSLTIMQIANRWSEVLDQVRKLKKSTHAFLMEGKPQELQGNVLVLVFKEGLSFHRDKVNQAENKETIEAVLKTIFGEAVVLKNVLENELTKSGSSSELADNPVVKKAADFFGADLIVVKE